MFMQRAFLFSLIVILVAGCSLRPPRLPDVQNPRIDSIDVAVTERTTDGVRVEITLLIYNPNDESLPMPNVYYSFNVDGLGSFRFDDIPAVSLPPENTQRLVLPAALAAGEQDITGRIYTVQGRISYHPPGEVQEMLKQTGFPLPWISFSHSGMLQ